VAILQQFSCSRFGYYGAAEKKQDDIHINDVLQVGKGTYGFLSGIIHHGISVECGHYTSLVKCPDGKFVSFDDEKVGVLVGIILLFPYLYFFSSQMFVILCDSLSGLLIIFLPET
jgi:ubiquitin C-terminal hydrolase